MDIHHEVSILSCSDVDAWRVHNGIGYDLITDIYRFVASDVDSGVHLSDQVVIDDG